MQAALKESILKILILFIILDKTFIYEILRYIYIIF